MNPSQVRSAVGNTVAHLRYLYSENEDTFVPWMLFGVPGVSITLTAIVIGYATTVHTLGPILSGSLATVIVLLDILAVAEAAPIMPISVIEGKKRYGIAAGYAWLALAVTMSGFIYTQMVTAWSHERAGVVAMMPHAMAALIVGGLAITGLAVAAHRLPAAAHASIMEYAVAGSYAEDMNTMRRAFYDRIIQLRRRSQQTTPFTDEEMKTWQRIAEVLFKQLGKIEEAIYADLTGSRP